VLPIQADIEGEKGENLMDQELNPLMPRILSGFAEQGPAAAAVTE
jgi:hypothetical protein